MSSATTGTAPFSAVIPRNALVGALRVSQNTTIAILEMHEDGHSSEYARSLVRLIPDPRNMQNPTERPRLFCPVPNDRAFYLGIGVRNSSDRIKAYPTFVGGANIYEGCSTDAAQCTPNEMWEVLPGQSTIMSHLVNPHVQQGRRLVITPRGKGYGIGEATFGTSAFAGQIAMYERDSQGRQYLGHHGGMPESFTTRGDLGTRGVPMGSGASKGLPSRSGGGHTLGMARGASHSRSVEPEVDVDIGAGAEQHVEHSHTGVTYSAALVVFPLIQLISEDEAAQYYSAIPGDSRNHRHAQISRCGDWWNTPHFAATGSHIPMAPALPHRRPHNG